MGGAGDGGGDPDRDAILARRRKLIAVALAGLTSTACGSSTCLRPLFDGGPTARDSGPRDSGMDAEPMPCLDVAVDAGEDGGDALDGGELDGSPDAEPMPCLTAKPPRDAGDDGDASA